MPAEFAAAQEAEGLNNGRNLQLSVGLTYSRSERLENLRRQRSRAFGLPVVISFDMGWGVRTSIATAVDYGERENLFLDSAATESDTRMGDLTIGLSYPLQQQGTSSPKIIANLNMGVPFKQSDGDVDGETLDMSLSFSRSVDPVLLFWNIGLTHVLSDSEVNGIRSRTGDSIPYGFGFAFIVNNSISIETRFNANYTFAATRNGTKLEGTGSEPMYFATGMTYSVEQGKSWGVELTYGLNDDAGDVEIGITKALSF